MTPHVIPTLTYFTNKAALVSSPITGTLTANKPCASLRGSAISCDVNVVPMAAVLRHTAIIAAIKADVVIPSIMTASTKVSLTACKLADATLNGNIADCKMIINS